MIRHHMLHKTPKEMVSFILPLDLWERYDRYQVETLRALGKVDEPDVSEGELSRSRDYARHGLDYSRMMFIVEESRNGRKN